MRSHPRVILSETEDEVEVKSGNALPRVPARHVILSEGVAVVERSRTGNGSMISLTSIAALFKIIRKVPQMMSVRYLLPFPHFVWSLGRVSSA